MSYDRGFLNKRIAIWRPKQEESMYGTGRTIYSRGREVWANVSFVKGKRALNNGHVGVYDTVMIRMDFHPDISRSCRIQVGKQYYVIDSFNCSQEDNEMQITAYEVDDIQKQIVNG